MGKEYPVFSTYQTMMGCIDTVKDEKGKLFTSGHFDLLICDEAHRLNEKSGMFHNMGENKIKEIIHAAGCSVFFINVEYRTASDVVVKSGINVGDRIIESADAEDIYDGARVKA